MPVHVFPLAIRAVVTDHHAVRIYYWTDPELVHFSQLVAKDLLREKEVNKTMYDKGAVSLSTVLRGRSLYATDLSNKKWDFNGPHRTVSFLSQTII